MHAAPARRPPKAPAPGFSTPEMAVSEGAVRSGRHLRGLMDLNTNHHTVGVASRDSKWVALDKKVKI